jgi:uncharacterized protein YhaN
MFVRFRRVSSRLQVSLCESRRAAGRIRQEHVAALGSIAEPMTIAGRIAFWLELRQRLDRLSNRIGDSQIKILDAVHTRVPMATVEEQRELQHQNAEADAKFWESLKGLNQATADDNKGLAEMASRTAADAETAAKDAAKEAATAKKRIARLNNGETLTGGLGTPRELTRKDLIKAGFKESDLQHLENLCELCNLLGEGTIKWLSKNAVKANERWARATVRRMLRNLRVLNETECQSGKA